MTRRVNRSRGRSGPAAAGMRGRAAAAALLCALGAGACASGRSGEPIPSEFDVRQVGECTEEPLPETLPDVERLLEVDRLSGPVSDVLEAEGLERAEITFSLGYQPDGLNMRRDVVEHTATPTAADTVQELVFAALRPQEEAEREWGVRLTISAGEAAGGALSYRVERRIFCPPTPRDPELESRMRGFFERTSGYSGRTSTVYLRVGVHPVGYVVDAKVVRGAGTGSSLERELFQFIRQFSFNPATIDGIAVYGEIDIPVTVRGD